MVDLKNNLSIHKFSKNFGKLTDNEALAHQGLSG